MKDSWREIEKACIRCGVLFVRNHWNRRLCGSKATKSGCAYEALLEDWRVRQTKSRKENPEKFRARDRKRRPAKGPFMKDCLSCGARFASKVVWGKYCGSRSEVGSCAYEAKKRAVKDWVSKNMPRILALNKAWEIAHPERAKQLHKKAYRRWRQTDGGKESMNRFSKIYKHQRRAGGALDIDAVLAMFRDVYQSKCACCESEDTLTIDHKIPVSKGGSNDIKNIQPLCTPCNSRKGDKTVIYPIPTERMLSVLSM